MKVEVYDEDKDIDQTVRLALQDDGDSGVDLVVVDEYGNFINGGALLTITKEGGLYLVPGVSTTLGLQLTKDDRKLSIS